MRRLSDSFAARAEACESLQDLGDLLGDAARELGFSYFALLHHASLRKTAGDLLRLENYPSAWAAEIVAGDLWQADPVHAASRHATAGFRWSELGSIIPLEPRQRSVLRRSERFGIGDGFTVPVNVPDEPSGSCSFAVERHRKLPGGRLMCAELIGLHAFKAARRLHPRSRRRERPHLSRREIECLRLVALGKSDWEIARILGIGFETARQYVKRARAAYDVATRTQLATRALLDRWIEPGDLQV